MEWRSPTVKLCLESIKYPTGSGNEEERRTLTENKTTGRLNLGLNLTADNGIDTANLPTGKLQF